MVDDLLKVIGDFARWEVAPWADGPHRTRVEWQDNNL